MNDDREEVTAEQFEVIRAVVGMEAEDFQRSKLGKYIFDRNLNEEQELIEELIACDPNDVSKNQSLRSDIQMRRMFEKYVNEAISSGRNAESNLDALEEGVY